MIENSRSGQGSADTGTRASEQDDTASRWPLAAAAILSGALFWIWLAAGSPTAVPQNPGPGTASELAQVDAKDIPAALHTMSPEFRSQYEKQERSCALPLAWVSVKRVAGQPTTTVRLRSGRYFSPAFTLSDAPQRIALPYPAPYETGHGVLTAMVAGGRGVVALTPPWLVSTRPGGAAGEVQWRVGNSCRPGNG